jgi:hypothetical protein
MRIVVALALAACTRADDQTVTPTPAPAPTPAPKPPPAPVPTVPEPSVPSTPDEAFQARIKAFQTTTGRSLVSWGTIKLDGTRPYRYALLEEGNRHPAMRNEYVYVCGNNEHTCRSVMIVEEATDKIWAIGYVAERMAKGPEMLMRVVKWEPAEWNGESSEDMLSAPPPESWRTLDDPALHFKMLHNHGELDVLYGLRGGTFVMLEVHDYHSRHGDTDVMYAKRGVCRSKCPSLASFESSRLPKQPDEAHSLVDMYMAPTIAGPTTWAALREPPVPTE